MECSMKNIARFHVSPLADATCLLHCHRKLKIQSSQVYLKIKTFFTNSYGNQSRETFPE